MTTRNQHTNPFNQMVKRFLKKNEGKLEKIKNFVNRLLPVYSTTIKDEDLSYKIRQAYVNLWQYNHDTFPAVKLGLDFDNPKQLQENINDLIGMINLYYHKHGKTIKYISPP